MENVDDDASVISSIPLNNSNFFQNLAEINTNHKTLIYDVNVMNKATKLLSTLLIFLYLNKGKLKSSKRNSMKILLNPLII